MSDPAVQPCNELDETRKRSMQPHQSGWMAHWLRTSSRSDSESHSQLPVHCKSGDENCVPKLPSLVPEPAKMETSSSRFVAGIREVNEANITSFVNESQLTSLKRPRSEAFDSQCFPMFRSSRGGERNLVPNNGESSGEHLRVVRSKIGADTGCDVSRSRTETVSPSLLVSPPSETEIGTGRSQFQHEEIKWNLEQPVKSSTSPKRSSLAVSTPFQVDHVGSSSEVVPYEFKNRRTTMQTLFGRQDNINQPGATFLVHGNKTNNKPGLFINDPSTSSIQLSNFVGQQFQKMKNHSDVELFPSLISPLNKRRFELQDGFYPLPRMSAAGGNLESMRICTTIDSEEKFCKGPSEFSQTTHHLFYTKKTDGGSMWKESAISTKFKGKTVSKLFSLPPHFGFHVQQGVKLQPLESSADSEEKDNTVKVKSSALNLNSESSAATDTMDMDAFRENRLSGTVLSPSNKDVLRGQKSPASLAAVPSAIEETRGGLLKTKLLDINQKPPVHLCSEGTADDKEASTSRTLSLGVDQFLFRAEEPTDSKSSPCLDVPSGLEPCSRWVNRLKPNVSDSFVHGGTGSKPEDASSHEQVNKLFGKIPKRKRTGSEPNASKSWGKEQMIVDQAADLQRNAESTSPVSFTKSQDIALSHFWIQRWCRNPSASSKDNPEVVAAHEPQSSKATFQGKQFPSIAAMALMGKAMNGFRPCHFRKRGSFVVWNTEG